MIIFNIFILLFVFILLNIIKRLAEKFILLSRTLSKQQCPNQQNVNFNIYLKLKKVKLWPRLNSKSEKWAGLV